jgi:hypothetical protein
MIIPGNGAPGEGVGRGGDKSHIRTVSARIKESTLRSIASQQQTPFCMQESFIVRSQARGSDSLASPLEC